MTQLHYVAWAYALGLGAILLLLVQSFVAMFRAERHAERLRAEHRR